MLHAEFDRADSSSNTRTRRSRRNWPLVPPNVVSLMDKMMIEPIIAGAIKICCCFAVAVTMLVYAPKVLKPVQVIPIIDEAQGTTMPERMATSEQRITALEHRMDVMESAKLSEQIVSLQDRIQGLLIISVPMALFVFVHTLQVLLGMRDKLGWTRRALPDEE